MNKKAFTPLEINVNQNQRFLTGFTLIELVMVMVIIGIVAVSAIPKFIAVQNRAKIASDDATMAALKTAINMQHMKSIMDNPGVDPDTLWPGAGSEINIFEFLDPAPKAKINEPMVDSNGYWQYKRGSGSAPGCNVYTIYCPHTRYKAGSGTPIHGRPYMYVASGVYNYTHPAGDVWYMGGWGDEEF